MNTPQQLGFNRKRLARTAWIKRFLQHGPWCHYCNVRLTVDTAVREHLTPICRGGVDRVENLAPSCTACNEMKAWRTEAEFIRDRPMLFARRTAARSRALRDITTLSLEEANEPGLLKRLTEERDSVSRWWSSTSDYRRIA